MADNYSNYIIANFFLKYVHECKDEKEYRESLQIFNKHFTFLNNDNCSMFFNDIQIEFSKSFDYLFKKSNNNKIELTQSKNTIKIQINKDVLIKSISKMFLGCNTLSSVNFSNFNTSQITDMSSLFYGCKSLTSINLSNIDTKSVTDMSCMFFGCDNLTELNLSDFQGDSLNDISCMFYGCTNLSNLVLTNFSTVNVNNMEKLFQNCSSLTTIDLKVFDTSNVTSFSYFFSN